MSLHVVGLLAVAAALSGCYTGETVTGPVAHPGVTLTPLAVGGQPWNVAVSRQGTVYVTQLATDSIARVAADSDRVAATFRVGNGPYDVTFNAAGSSAYVTNLYDHTVGVINTSTRTQTGTFPVAGGAVRARLGPGETKLYVTLDNGGLVVLNSTSGAVATTIPLGSVPLNGLALTSDRSRLYVSSVGGSVTEINTAADTVMRSFTLGGRPQDLVVGPGDSTLYAANEAGWVQVWDLKTWTRADSIAVPAAFGLALTPDGKQLWVTETQLGQVAVVDCVSGAVVETIPVLGAPRHLAITPDGTTAVVANQAGAVQIIR
jgi:YVTN family beta-propeller protein